MALRDTLRCPEFTSASLIGRLGQALSGYPPLHSSVEVAHGLALLFGLGTKALPSWDSKTRWNKSFERRCRQCDGRFKRTYELTSSIVLRGTSFHRWVELEFPPTAFDPAQISSRCDLPRPSEFGAIDPDAMHDHGQSARQGHDRPFHPAALRDLHRPGFEPGPFLRPQHALSCFVEHDPHHLISAA